MALVLLLGRLVLAAIFAIAGAAKLADRKGSRQAVINFGLPGGVAPVLGVAIPAAELAVALLLVPVATAWWGAVCALGLLLMFLVAIGYNLARGRRPACHCFGQLHSEPAGWPTLARNTGLAGVAALVVAWEPPGTGLSAFAWLAALTKTEATLLAILLLAVALVAAQGWFLAQLFARHGRMLMRLDVLEARLVHAPAPMPAAIGAGFPANAPIPQGLPVGAPAPALELPTLSGERGSLAALLAGKRPVVLLFLEASCGPCTELLPEVARWHRQHADILSLAIVSSGTARKNRNRFAKHDLPTILLQEKTEALESYSARGTPSAVLVSPNGRVGSAVAAGSEEIKALIERAITPGREVPGNGQAPVGTVAPALELPDLEGNLVDLARFRGRDTLVLLWDPNCGFCQRMLPDLRRLDAAAESHAPQVVVVSSGTPDAIRAMGLSYAVVLDPSFAAGRSFGARGTPSAVLVDAAGMIASEVAAGPQAVLALAAPLEFSDGRKRPDIHDGKLTAAR